MNVHENLLLSLVYKLYLKKFFKLYNGLIKKAKFFKLYKDFKIDLIIAQI
jgi:hypothetical protein